MGNMTDKEILQKAIEKAEKNGYRANWETFFENIKAYVEDLCIETRTHYALIFNHDFAKAFFYEGRNHLKGDMRHWRGRLQQMVLEKEPLKYIEKFL